MNPSLLATEGWIWARAARRRYDAATTATSGAVEEADRLADLAQSLEALDRALRYAERITDAVAGTELPSGVDWDRVGDFARRSRDAVAHGDERLTQPGLGYHVRTDRGVVRVFGRAKGEKHASSIELPMTDLDAAIDALTSWLEREASM